jgi:Flp pilus assembly protein TadD
MNVGPRLSAAIANPAQRDQRETALFHLSTGKTLIASHRDREAADELRRAIYLAPYDHEPHLLLGQVYHRAGQLPQAVDELKVAIWCQDSAPARLALATVLLDSGDVVGARVEVERALALAPNSTEADNMLRRLGG